MTTDAEVLKEINHRLIRMETTLFKFCMHGGMNPKSGQPIRKDPINFNVGGTPDTDPK